MCGEILRRPSRRGRPGGLAGREPHRGPTSNRILSSKYRDETGLCYYGYRFYISDTGRWLNLDPGGEGQGENLFGFLENQPPNAHDFLGLWLIHRLGGRTARAESNLSTDTLQTLAETVGLRYGQIREWLTVTRTPGAPRHCWDDYDWQVPNTVLAYWAGHHVIYRIGKPHVNWGLNVKYLRSLGFFVPVQDHLSGRPELLRRILKTQTLMRWLHGVYYWGHGDMGGLATMPYWPSGRRAELVLDYGNPGIEYDLALGLMYACDSNFGRVPLQGVAPGAPGAIWHGYPTRLYPILPFRWDYNVGHFIRHGDQGTR
jgi:RHS repeat-associated protein